MARYTRAPSALEMMESIGRRMERAEADIDKLKQTVRLNETKQTVSAIGAAASTAVDADLIARIRNSPVVEKHDLLQECLGVLRLCADGVMNPAMGEGRVTTMKLVRKLEAAVFPAQCGTIRDNNDREQDGA